MPTPTTNPGPRLNVHSCSVTSAWPTVGRAALSAPAAPEESCRMVTTVRTLRMPTAMKTASMTRAVTKPRDMAGKRRLRTGYSATAVPMFAMMRMTSAKAPHSTRVSSPVADDVVGVVEQGWVERELGGDGRDVGDHEEALRPAVRSVAAEPIGARACAGGRGPGWWWWSCRSPCCCAGLAGLALGAVRGRTRSGRPRRAAGRCRGPAGAGRAARPGRRRGPG